MAVQMADQTFDPTRPRVEKLQVEAAEPPPPDGAALKARIAEKVRADSTERKALTSEFAIRALEPELPRERLSALLAEMGSEDRYGDIKAIVTPSGRIYLFSEAQLVWIEASDQARNEEAKIAIVQQIRADSRRTALTAAADLEPLFPTADPEERDRLVAELRADPRFADIGVVTGPKGETYYHSDLYLSGSYAGIQMRAKLDDPLWAIAAFVRERSRIMPTPTKLSLFEEPVFGIDPAKLSAFVDEVLKKPEYADLKKMVHPTTGAIYLYSEKYLEAKRAFFIMDWDEVGAAQNP